MELFQKIEALIGKKMEQFTVEQDAALVLLDRVNEALALATMQVSCTATSCFHSAACWGSDALLVSPQMREVDKGGKRKGGRVGAGKDAKPGYTPHMRKRKK